MRISNQLQQAVTLHQQGKLSEAKALYEQILSIEPHHFDALQLLGAAERRLGNYDTAITLLDKAIAINSHVAAVHNNKGLALHDINRFDEALLCYQKAIALEPDFVEAYNNYGNALKELNRLDEAFLNYQKAIALKPDFAEAYNNQGVLLKELNRLNESLVSYQKAIELKPSYAEAYNNQGVLLECLNKFDEALHSYQKAIELNPHYAEAYNNKGNALQDLNRFNDALQSYQKAIAFKPNYAEAYNNQGNALKDLNRLDKAFLNYQKAIELKPDLTDAHSNLIFISNHAQNTTYQQILEIAKQFNDVIAQNLTTFSLNRVKDKNKPLNIAFVSGDFFNHPVAVFIEPLLIHINKTLFNLFAYYNNIKQDEVTKRLKQQFSVWHDVHHLSDKQLAQQMYDDEIDILIDLSGHTAKNRLPALAYKSAPIQCSWIGYPGTTGLETVDYYLADKYWLPVGEFDHWFTEKLVYLPSGSTFTMPDAPLSPLPALTRGFVTFGSFNRASKISPQTLDWWCEVLKALPESKMLIGNVSDKTLKEHFENEFKQRGIALERLDFRARVSVQAYWQMHSDVDLLLDTFPYNGGTTNYTAIAMGVPVITYAENTPASRSGVGILSIAGIEKDFVAYSREEFIEKAVYWHTHLQDLQTLRRQLRERIQQSPRFDPAIVTRGFEKAMQLMWARYCEDLPVTSFVVNDEMS